MDSPKNKKVIFGLIIIVVLFSTLACTMEDALEYIRYELADFVYFKNLRDKQIKSRDYPEEPNEAVNNDRDLVQEDDDLQPAPSEGKELIVPPETGLGMVISEGEALSPSHTVVVYKGNALDFVNKPDVIAYANFKEYSAPEGVTLAMSSESGTGTYLQAVFLIEEGAWLQASTTKPVTSVGVQIWGDADDGWAEIFVDDIQVWRGYTRGTGPIYPGEAYVNYVEINSLELGPHTVKVRNGGGGVTTVFFIGFGGLYE